MRVTDTTETTDETPVGVFAFGSDTISVADRTTTRMSVAQHADDERCDSIACPASFAGYAPSDGDESVSIANCYDGLIERRLRHGTIDRLNGRRIVNAEVARSAWLDAIATFRYVQETDGITRTDLPLVTRSDDEPVVTGEAIARELGWLEPDETVAPRRPSEFGLELG